MIVIDEPTAALDAISEERLYRKIIKKTSGMTTILISHRLGSVKTVDRILVMDKGIIVEDGSHVELIKKNGIYAKMYKSQAKLYNR